MGTNCLSILLPFGVSHNKLTLPVTQQLCLFTYFQRHQLLTYHLWFCVRAIDGSQSQPYSSPWENSMVSFLGSGLPSSPPTAYNHTSLSSLHPQNSPKTMLTSPALFSLYPVGFPLVIFLLGAPLFLGTQGGGSSLFRGAHICHAVSMCLT